MKFSTIALAGVASAANFNATIITVPHTITTTTVVDEYVTYCPEPTHIIEGNKTITVTTPGTVTITDCPCTRTLTTTTLSLSTKPIGTKTNKPGHSSGEPDHPTTPGHQTTIVSPTANTTSTRTTVSQGDATAYGASGAFAGVVAAIAYFL